MPSTPRRAAIAVAAVLTAVTLVACSSGDGVRNAVAVGGCPYVFVKGQTMYSSKSFGGSYLFLQWARPIS